MTTLLRITSAEIPDYAARGLEQTLFPIPASQSLRRTVNGDLVDLSASQFRKYGSTITCTDQRVPALDGIWPGMTVTVDCVAELSYRTGGTPQRDLADTTDDDATYTDGDFTYYRPRLTMIVIDYRTSFDEYGARVGWSLDLEEV